jgi:subfamily B ATP-binding cassette protein MsbA
MKIFRRLLAYFGAYRARAGAALLAMVLVALSTGAMMFFFRSMFDDVLVPAGRRVLPAASHFARVPAGASHPTALLMREADAAYSRFKAELGARGVALSVAVPLLLFLSLLSKNLFSFLSESAFNSVGLAMVRDLRDDAYARLLHQSSAFFTSASSGDLMSRFLSDVELIQGAFGTRIADLVQGALTIAVVLVYVTSLNLRLTLLSLVVAPLLLWPIIEITRRLRRTTAASRARMGAIGEILQEAIRGHRIIKTYGTEEQEAGRFREANQKYFRANLKMIRLQALSSPLMEILSGAGLTVLFVYAAQKISAGAMTAGDFLSFLIALLTIYTPIKNVTKVNLSLQQALAAAERLFELMDRSSDIREGPGARPLARFGDAIRFENVSFSYGQTEVLSGINLKIKRGETVALVGPSGVGKTTLVNLLPRLYDCSSGRITIDGKDIRDVTLRSLRAQIALVTQETVLFEGSVRNNIAYGSPEASEEAVIAASRAARADEFVRLLPEGYESRVGENAARLSGGERQRLSIARALFRNAPILILDEATSQLDSESESAVGDALTNLMAGRTTLVIAHRLSTVRRADRIVVLQGGRIVEEGTHAQLLDQSGLYSRLYEMQYFEREEPHGVSV